MPLPDDARVPVPAMSATPGLSGAWQMALSPAGAWATPAEARAGDWHPAIVPGTAAASLERLGLWDRRDPTPLHAGDVWYATTITGNGPTGLIFEGLATIAEVWLNETCVARSETMFAPLSVDLDLQGEHRLALAFRSLTAALAARTAPRARWRTRMVDDPKLRLVRTTILGNAPGWCPPVHAVGPWRPIRIVSPACPQIQSLRSEIAGLDGLVTVAVALPGFDGVGPVTLVAESHSAPLTRGTDGLWHGHLRIPQVELWWPRTHGTPRLYDLRLNVGAEHVPIGRTGFRTIAMECGADGRDFQILVNGTRIFCRGLCWTPDLVTLDGSREALEPILRTIAAAHVNMLRVGGTMVYESAAFHALCDELGILVWQDCMLANFDYPRDASFMDAVLAEVRALLRRTAGSPSLALLCGGSEILQQAAMMGLAPASTAHPLFDSHLPALLAEERPDLAYVPGSPSGGPLPFVADHGPSHYYGVGAYRRPLADARRAAVRFASECLAFSNVPEDATLEATGLDPVRDPAGWAAGVPHDNGADWTFEDTRHHYMALLHGVDAAALRADDPQRYLDLSRATVAEVTERTFDEWRRPASITGGSLVWFARDLGVGAGWGVIDVLGRPKANFYALRRAFAPQRLFITDEGVNGLTLHCLNDGAMPISGRLTLECLRNGSIRVVKGEQACQVPARGGISLSAFALLGSFFDAGDAYRFGPPPHDVVIATFEGSDGLVLEAFWHPEHARPLRHDVAPVLSLQADGKAWVMGIEASRALRHVVIADKSLVPDDNWFHVAPGRSKRIKLRPMDGRAALPSGLLRALDLDRPIPYG